MKLPAIDKQAHFWWGWAIAATLYPVDAWLAVFAAAALGALKEYWDSKGHGTPDKYDWVATLLGGLVGVLACDIVRYLTQQFTGG